MSATRKKIKDLMPFAWNPAREQFSPIHKQVSAFAASYKADTVRMKQLGMTKIYAEHNIVACLFPVRVVSESFRDLGDV